MKNFIEVPQEGNNVLINVNHILMVEKDGSGSRISLAIRGNHNYAFQYVDSSLSYEQVIELIKNAR
jgi:hypothetical protein